MTGEDVIQLVNELRATTTSRIPLTAKTLGMANAWQDGFLCALKLVTRSILAGEPEKVNKP